MAIPPRLESELIDLRKTYSIDVIEEPSVINLLFRQFSLGEGFNVSVSDLLIRAPRTYPDAGPDMFWVEEKVRLSTGVVPQSAESIEQHIGQRWRRFSWHWKNRRWNPNIDNMHSYLEFIRRRLREKR